MKKILYILLCIPLIFSSCKKEDVSPNSNSNSNNNPVINTSTGFYHDYGYFFKTTDGGQSWTQQNSTQQSTYIDHVSFVD